ncbi:hypothetical protein [Wenyingzhuangia sp. 2_MG-2023]|uniref:hypothetical protein n=1 Tax=Wenyingzhuangia sp. 2_MG-2023 TaxID=3062639 RepID=UPI0026E367AA|nr:hypothetical protein [Wenyingzhuangia sp. 2_MG-2023]MDO6737835.1 hypothetical protein [Wenyingzhuangia sp. 2_MG-2023]
MKIMLFYFFTLSSFSFFSQSKFPDWDKNYILKNLNTVLSEEINYSKKIQKDTTAVMYYIAATKIRFLSKFTGNVRKINQNNIDSMDRVFMTKFGKKNFTKTIVDHEYEFVANDTKIWMPIQKVLEDDFLKEINKNAPVLLYTLHLNEHTSERQLFNHFLISEFSKDWQ